ncbi:flagellar basal body rod protein FlgB [Pontibacillus chungwhensis BH030062]|uniref:Flagellar basal body rod protein FlgB n=1 Tax=Pontibacillus chungwhensis BH030062 TaxID=1385513 RepID=A0A0A2V1H9_9BACI|nr:flagellar basal body rod protein FlgB [Pontibacillus chungwhensis]KGP92853.1 flagellar basal body rod protein FlgB [Pontibacillus chungwhensis BH030062]
MTMFGGTIQTLEKSMDYASLKNKTISNNIANVDTPNYKAKDVQFKDVFSEQMSSIDAKRTNSKHIPFSSTSTSRFSVTSNGSTQYNHNGNNVDIDQEMSDLAKNQIYYQALVDRLNGKFRSLESVIKGGR